ncbi:hypothetical protein TWF173_005510 [Orbilia oligospora]|nr:hypothetical protein TWF173_005510 [Orbilia oligospora]
MKHDYPEPFVVEASSRHTQTCILLHGRGSNGPKFGEALLASQTADGSTLRDIFPSMKFIFPTAKKRRSTILKRIPINQWFDNYSLEDPSMREHLQVDGLRETTEVVHQIIRDEVSSGISLSNIILGGLSQGCAASIYALLTFDEKLGAYIGAFNINTHGFGFGSFDNEEQDEEESGTIGKEDEEDEEESEKEESDEEESEEEEERDETGNGDGEVPIGAGQNEKTTTSTSNSTNASKSPLKAIETPAFLGHGEEDEKVSVLLGKQARDGFLGLSMDVSWKAYAAFEHWYKVPGEIDDIVVFLKKNMETLS